MIIQSIEFAVMIRDRADFAMIIQSIEFAVMIQHREMVLKHGGAPLVAESGLGRQPECTG